MSKTSNIMEKYKLERVAMQLKLRCLSPVKCVYGFPFPPIIQQFKGIWAKNRGVSVAQQTSRELAAGKLIL